MTIQNWNHIYGRLSRLTRDEILDRSRQELAKRADAALHWLGYDFAGSLRNAHAPSATSRGKFFFEPNSVDSIFELLRKRLPGRAEQIVLQAEQICRHRFDLLGYEDVDYGGPIDWHLDAVHGKRAPRKAFYRVRYLDYAEVGDSKVTWELNRHQHLVTLAKAYRLTGERRYADEILRQWRDWQAENPYPVGINWASSLEVAFRSLSWLWTYHLLQGAAGVPDFRDEWLRSLAQHGRHIERYLSTYFSPNTHLLGEGVGLFFLGVLCPELAAAERWKRVGWEIIVREAERQVHADGFHFEQSTYYHVYALDFFLHAAVLAGVNGIPAPKKFEDTIEKMLTALCLLSRGGSPPRFGDDDGGRLFDPRRNRGEHLLDPLATGAILFHRGDFKTAAGGLREETLWLLGEEGVRQWDALDEAAVSHESAALPDAGLYLLTAEKLQLVVDAGPLGAQSGGHGHADALSICLQSRGHSLLIDPGTYQYIGPWADRDLFRGTAMHNTLRVDGANQTETATAFSWQGRLTESKVEQWIQGRNFDLLVASHNGYQRLESPVTHRRWVLSLMNGIFLVRDVVEGAGRHRLDVAWHLGQKLQVVKEGVFRMGEAADGLAILSARGQGWEENVRRESWSPAYGQKAPMTVLNFGTEAALPAEFAVLLVTTEEAQGVIGSFSRIEVATAVPDVREYQYAIGSVVYAFFFGKAGRHWRRDSLSSDAEFVCRRQGPGEAEEQLFLCGGSYVQVDGGLELRCSRPVSWAESIANGTGLEVFSSDVAALVNHSVPEAVSEQASTNSTSTNPD
jgi:heparinase II/III-like protein